MLYLYVSANYFVNYKLDQQYRCSSLFFTCFVFQINYHLSHIFYCLTYENCMKFDYTRIPINT